AAARAPATAASSCTDLARPAPDHRTVLPARPAPAGARGAGRCGDVFGDGPVFVAGGGWVRYDLCRGLFLDDAGEWVVGLRALLPAAAHGTTRTGSAAAVGDRARAAMGNARMGRAGNPDGAKVGHRPGKA